MSILWICFNTKALIFLFKIRFHNIVSQQTWICWVREKIGKNISVKKKLKKHFSNKISRINDSEKSIWNKSYMFFFQLDQIYRYILVIAKTHEKIFTVFRSFLMALESSNWLRDLESVQVVQLSKQYPRKKAPWTIRFYLDTSGT